MTTLVKYDAARTALAAATKVDDAKDIRDKAVALKAYARQINDADMEKWVAEIKARAERRAGELLKEMAPNSQPRSGKKGVSSQHDTTLKSIGVSRDQSATWQQIARIPEAKFEKAIATATRPITTKALLAKPAPKVKVTKAAVAPGECVMPSAEHDVIAGVMNLNSIFEEDKHTAKGLNDAVVGMGKWKILPEVKKLILTLTKLQKELERL